MVRPLPSGTALSKGFAYRRVFCHQQQYVSRPQSTRGCTRSLRCAMFLEVTTIADPATQLPLVVIDTTALHGALPSEETILAAITKLPVGDHVVVFFAAGSPKAPNLPWLHRAYKLIPRSVKKRIKKVYLVHGKWWTRSLQKMFGGLLSSKFARKMILIDSLSALARHIDITVLNISPQVYLADLAVESVVTVPKHTTPQFRQPLPACPGSLWSQCLQYLWSVRDVQAHMFERTNGSPLVLILRQSFDRSQLLDLNDYGPQVTVAVLKLYLLELPSPLLEVDTLPLPMADTEQYTRNILNGLTPAVRVHLGQLGDWLSHVHDRNGVPLSHMAANMSPALCKLWNPSRDQAAIASRFLRNMIEHWPALSRHAPSSPKRPAPPPRPALRDVKNIAPIHRPQVPIPGLKPKPSLRNIRGERVAEMAQKYEPLELPVGPSPSTE